MNFIKTHWFGLLTGAVIFVFFVMFILILLSPRQDLQRRGFIPCTETMADALLECSDHKISCLVKAVVKNSACDLRVIGRGMKDWASGKQPAPWSNYIFIPELPPQDSFDEEARAEYLKKNPNTKQEMLELKKLNEELENEQDEIFPSK